MPLNTKVAVWDSCVIIDAIQKTPGRYGKIEPFLKDAESGNFQIVISENSVGEVSYLSGLDKEGVSKARQRQLISEWLDNPYIIRRTVHPGISALAAKLGDEHNIKRVGDRTVIATAVFEQIPLVHTFDGSGSKPGILALDNMIPLDDTAGSQHLHICVPNYYAGTLLEGADG